MQLDQQEIQSWLNHTYTKDALYPALRELESKLVSQLERGKFQNLEEVKLIQKELELVRVYLNKPVELLSYIKTRLREKEDEDE